MSENFYSIVVPVYNEEENLQILNNEIVDVMNQLQSPYEIIYIDDGSKDKSLDVLKSLKSNYPQIRIIVFEKNSGQSAALDAGFRKSRGNVVVTMDADLQNDPKDIPLLLEALKSADAAVGWRATRKDSLKKKITSRLGNFFRNLFLGEKIHDTGCSLKAFRKEAIERLKLFRGMHRFLPALVSMEGYKVVEVKVNHRPRVYGKTKYGFFDRFFAATPDLFAVLWMKKRVIPYRIKEEI
ncbi:MAG: glycosyltransferase family 2 protein [Acidobacteria bacterium]|nr:glycosyltransferase family 2 protein [Acidobacteriota bacterium]